MDRQPPTQAQHAVRSSSDATASTSRTRFSHIYALQVQGFIEAAEVVDVHTDIVEDLLEDLARATSLESGNDEEEVDVDVESTTMNLDHEVETVEWGMLLKEALALRGGAIVDQLPSRSCTEKSLFCVCIAKQAWTREEVKQMMTTLKEHGMTAFIMKYYVDRHILVPKLLYAFGICLCPELREKPQATQLYFLKVALQRELECREKLTQYKTIEDAVLLIQQRQRILILTGAGISVSCGIPDFRSRNGLYASLQESGEYDLDDPQQMFDINYFREKPTGFRCYYFIDSRNFSKIYSSNFKPSPCHRFIKAIEDRGKLLRNYTQNIDTLETSAGVKRVLQCHGSFATASCLNCKIRVPGTDIEDDILNHNVPLCKVCNATLPAKQKPKKKRKSSGWNSDQSDEPDPPEFPPGIMKPDITFFGEKLSDEFDKALLEDRQQIDLLIIIGTSLKVTPVSDIIANLPHSVPQILINKTPIRHINPDIVLLGNADDVVLHLCRKLGWDLPGPNGRSLTAPSTHSLKKRPSANMDPEPQRVGNRRVFCEFLHGHVWLFEGAEGGKWVEDIARRYADDSEGEASDEADDTPPPPPNPRQKAKRARLD
ncbi:SIR2-domain-containing protein [Rhodofomes roseus]|uniref:SIR2-domain-containing protein n=1 Tax=Rhodofomes roseus TaxID=34475 RepID=A0ABQ8KNS5_9APHY|nr:SIR2-domain-containing protein [Rhodofomes roseus]KAH9840078.1 SIR2-domain-containing protein [Rhodofomes roseus]